MIFISTQYTQPFYLPYKHVCTAQMTWAPFNGIYFSVYEYCKIEYAKYSNSSGMLANLPCTAVAGTVASILTSPLDLVKTRLQVQASIICTFTLKQFYK